MFDLFLLLLFLSALISIVYSTIRLGISPLPTWGKTKYELLRLLPASIKGDIYELGSGWGNLILPLSKKYPNNQIIAYEYSLIPFLISKLIIYLLGIKNIQLLKEDFLKADLSNAALIITYLCPPLMQKLSQKIEKKTLVISNTFALPNRKATKIKQVDDLFHTTLYFYQ